MVVTSSNHTFAASRISNPQMFSNPMQIAKDDTAYTILTNPLVVFVLAGNDDIVDLVFPRLVFDEKQWRSRDLTLRTMRHS